MPTHRPVLADATLAAAPLHTLDVYGGEVQGLLLAADQDDQPADEFA